MHEPLILYSTNTWLAYAVAERFYGGVHHAWCSPVYDARSAAGHVTIPPSSSPAEIYRALSEDARRGERHSALFARKLEGVTNAAHQKAEAGLITKARAREIQDMVEKAHPAELRPVLYVIPFAGVRERVAEVPVADRAHPFSLEFRIFALPRAHPFSLEFRIFALPRACFDVIEFWR